jgi:hypothetical protein
MNKRIVGIFVAKEKKANCGRRVKKIDMDALNFFFNSIEGKLKDSSHVNLKFVSFQSNGI